MNTQITSEQAFAIINASNRFVIDHSSEKKVFFGEIDDFGNEALFYYDEAEDEPILLAPKCKLEKCTWYLDHGYIEADLDGVRVWNGDVYIKPERVHSALV